MIKKMLLVFTVTTVFSMAAMSASQLRAPSRAAAVCGNPCTTSAQCARPCGCLLRPQDGGVCRL